MVERPGNVPRPARRVAGPVKVERDPNDLQLADELAVGLVLDLVDEAVHRVGDIGEVVAQPNPVELRRHGREVVGWIVTMPVTWVTLPS